MTRKKIPTSVEAQVIYKSDFKCTKCHKEFNLKIHHINGNKNDNRENNLILLCGYCHNLAESKSPVSKRLTPASLRKYKSGWEITVKKRRNLLKYPPSEARLIRFDGKDINTVYLEVKEGVLKAFQDGRTLDLMGFEWGNVDVLQEADRSTYKEQKSLSRLEDCRKVRLKFSNGTIANEVYLIWDDGKKHHIPDPETLEELGGFKSVKDIDYKEFNAIPRGKRLRTIYDYRIRKLFKKVLREGYR